MSAANYLIEADQKMKEKTPSHQLLDEYGLNEVTYKLLVLVAAATEPLSWKAIKPIAAYYKITGNPAPSLHKLVDRGLLTGPARTEYVGTYPFAITDQGRDILARIQRGLHRWEWITPARAEALKTLIRQHGSLIYSPKIHGHKFSRATLDSLVKHGYLRKDFSTYRLTDLGREAWAEYLTSVPLGKGVGESQFPPPATPGTQSARRGAGETGGEGNG